MVPGIKDEKAKEKEQAALMSSILSGKFANLPPKRPTEVRVFLSSTFVGMLKDSLNTSIICFFVDPCCYIKIHHAHCKKWHS